MQSITISDIFIYPVKSARGIRLEEATVTDRGLEHDRRFMIVDADGRFITQRKHERLALLDVQIRDDILRLTAPGHGHVEVPLHPRSGSVRAVTVWKSKCAAISLGLESAELLSAYLGNRCELVYMPDESERLVDPCAAAASELVSFADAYPYLLLSEASLAALGERVGAPVPMNRFRPNFVVSGAGPHEEDTWSTFTLRNLTFRAAKPCGRCEIVKIDQETGEKGEEPFATLLRYRTRDHNVLFGQYLLHEGHGAIRRGDVLSILERA